MRYLVLYSLCILCSFSVHGQGGNNNLLGRGNRVPGQKDSINLYLNFQDLWGLDMKEGTFNANFYTIMESTGDRASMLQYINGEIENKYFDSARKPYYEAWNIGKFRTHISFKDYPLDRQRLNILIEAGENVSKTVLYTVKGESKLIGEYHLQGWKVKRIISRQVIHDYKHFNNIDARRQRKYWRVVISIIIERDHRWIYLFKLFFPSFISMLILMIGFLFPPDKLEARFGLGVASIFGVISALILVQQDLPELARLTLIEILNYIAILTVFATLVIFGISYTRSRKGKDIKKFERISFTLLILFYFIASAGIILLRK